MDKLVSFHLVQIKFGGSVTLSPGETVISATQEQFPFISLVIQREEES